jgi:hypothetical protein
MYRRGDSRSARNILARYHARRINAALSMTYAAQALQRQQRAANKRGRIGQLVH